MSALLQNPLSNSIYRIKLYLATTHPQFNPAKSLNFSLSFNPSNPSPSHISKNLTYPLQRNCHLLQNSHRRIKAYDSISNTAFQDHEKPNKSFNFDSFLSALESFCVVSSLVVSVGCIVNWVFFGQQNLGLVAMGNKALVCLLAGAVAIGSVIRRRQWRRVCGYSSSKSTNNGDGNVIERIEKLEESMKSATTLIRMLSRQLEKLGIRFRVHRKALKEPIAETAALAQKNSEATRALAVQEDILEKELSEVQKVLLAMQDQQQKQLELILAIAKSGKLLDAKQAPSQGPSSRDASSMDKRLKQVPDGKQIEGTAVQKVATNDKAFGS